MARIDFNKSDTTKIVASLLPKWILERQAISLEVENCEKTLISFTST